MMTKFRKGDTLIEVMFAVSIFAMIMIGGLALMNSGLAKSQATLQLSMVRNAIDSQAEALRYVNSVYVANYPENVNSGTANVWREITNGAVARASNFQSCPTLKADIPPSAFVMDTVNAIRKNRDNLNIASTYPRLIYDGETDTNRLSAKRNFNSAEGLWIEAVRGDGTYFDFHIRACWNAPGINAPMTIGTIVRLYVPN